jgi:hypothetical protein
MDFRALLASRGWLHYPAFDLLWLNGKDLRGQPLIKRKRRLEQLIPPITRRSRGCSPWRSMGPRSLSPCSPATAFVPLESVLCTEELNQSTS